jgi:hypothetical protein
MEPTSPLARAPMDGAKDARLAREDVVERMDGRGTVVRRSRRGVPRTLTMRAPRRVRLSPAGAASNDASGGHTRGTWRRR